MADETPTDQQIEQYKKLKKAADDAAAAFQRLKDSGSAAKAELDAKRQSMDQANQKLREYTASLSGYQAILIQNTIQKQKFAKAANESRTAMGLLGGQSSSLVQSLRRVGAQFAAVAGTATLIGTNVGRSVISPFSSTKEVTDRLITSLAGIPLIGPKLATVFANVNHVLRAHKEAVDLVNRTYLGFGGRIDFTEAKTHQMERAIRNASTAFGFSRDAILRMVRQASIVPGVMDNMRKSWRGSAIAGKDLIGAMLAMRGAGMDAGQAGQLVVARYKRFGEVGQVVAQQIRLVAGAAKASGVNIEIAKDQVVAASEPLAIFGRKSGEAARLWTTFVDALRNQVPIEQVGRMVQQLTRNLADLDIGRRAFISQMGGGFGGGALGGALKMELDLRAPGGLNRSMEALTRSIARFGGGRILTLEQAANNPALQMQFQLQRQLVGKLAGVQGGQAQARVLEVLQKMQSGGISQLQASKSLKDLTKTGASAQQRSLTALDRIGQLVSHSNAFLQGISRVEHVAAGHLEHIRRTLIGPRGRLGQPRDLRRLPGMFRVAGRDIGRAGKDEARQAMSFLSRMSGALRARPKLPSPRPVIDPRHPGVPQPLVPLPMAGQRKRVRLPDVTLRPPPLIDPRRPAMNVPLLNLAPAARRTTLRRDMANLPRPEPATAAGGTADAAGSAGAHAILAGARLAAAGDQGAAIPDQITVRVVCEQCGHNLKQHIEKLQRGLHGVNMPGNTYSRA